MVPPPNQAVHVFIKIIRDQKLYFQSKRYKVDPPSGSGGSRAKITFLEGEIMESNNKYYSNKDKWESKDFWVYVMSESSGGNV